MIQIKEATRKLGKPPTLPGMYRKTEERPVKLVLSVRYLRVRVRFPGDGAV